MKKKILSGVLLIALIINTLNLAVFAAGEQSACDTSVVSVLDGQTFDEKYNLNSVPISYSNMKICKYGTTDIMQTTNQTANFLDNSNNRKYYWSTYEEDGYESLYYTFSIAKESDPEDSGNLSKTFNNIATVFCKDALLYNGNKYTLKMDINSISKLGVDQADIKIRCGKRPKSNIYTYNPSTYTMPVLPHIGVQYHKHDSKNSVNTKVDIDITYTMLDENNNPVNFSGLMGILDIDLNQGIKVHDFVTNPSNTFMEEITITGQALEAGELTTSDNDILYSYDSSSTTFLAQNEKETKHANVYLLMDEKPYINMNFSFDSLQAYSHIFFSTNVYKKIDTSVVNGQIDPSIQNIPTGSNKTINYRPNNSSTQYLKSITVDGEKVDVTQYPNSYTFTNIQEDHSIEVVYGNIHKITYILNGGTNNPSNPGTFKDNEHVTFKAPTREGYDFLGWYEDSNFTTPITDFVNRTSDVTVYAKWEAASDTAYKVEHYKENDNGQYQLADTENLTADTDTTVTATPKNYTGYEENTQAEGRKVSGIVTADGELVLRLFYDKIKYKVTFDPKNDTTIDDQIVKFEEKATEPTKPTKEGYTFEYWYFINDDNEEEKYDFDTPVVKDTHLIAKWKEDKKETTPTPSSTPTDTDKTQTAGKIDNTIANKVIAKAGNEMWIFVVAIIGVIGGALAYKYFKYKDIK